MHDIENVPQDFKIHHLPLARIKKVMKTDEDVKVNEGVTAVFCCLKFLLSSCFAGRVILDCWHGCERKDDWEPRYLTSIASCTTNKILLHARRR